MTIERPMFPPRADSAGELYRRTDISPEQFFQTLGRVRRQARDEIERLIEWLDSTIDVDQDEAADDRPCDEDSDREPSLGSFDSMSNQIKAWQTRFVAADVDCELDRCDDEESDHAEDGGDHEAESDTGIGDVDGLNEQLAGTRSTFGLVE
jgi:hypothetical protein